jgi:hypothetical protein
MEYQTSNNIHDRYFGNLEILSCYIRKVGLLLIILALHPYKLL